ncbi:MAG: glutathione S-transferase family protein [Kofleriaceae bacterium]
MKLYGTTTSPYVRRVRIVAAEVGEPVELVNTAPEAGQAALQKITPIRKVPIAIVGDRTLFDSRVIIDWLVTFHGHGELEPSRDRWRDANIVNAIDAAVDSVIQVFYLRRDAIEAPAFAQRQLDRADAIFAWLGTQLGPGGESFAHGFGLAELSLVCALDWMEFRQVYPIERAAGVAGIRVAWNERPSVVATRPHA